jgi:hypothetical protein
MKYFLMIALCASLGAGFAQAKDKKATAERKVASAQKYCGSWVVGPHGYHTEYEHFKPSTLLGTVKDNKFNVQVLAKTEGGAWPVLADVDRNVCICVLGERQGKIMKSVTNVYDCNGGKERVAPEENWEEEGEENT